MNLLFFYSSEILPQKGGVQRVTDDLKNYFTVLGHKVIYLSTQIEGNNKLTYACQYFLPNSMFLNSKENIEFYQKLVNKNNIDIIINQSGTDPDLTRFCICIKKLLNVKVISVIHNSLLGNVIHYTSSHNKQIKRIPIPFLTEMLQTKLILKILLKTYILKYKSHYTYSCNKCDKVVLLSESFSPELEAFVPNCDLSKITVIANPCTLKVKESMIIKKNELLYVGRINTAQKRVDLLLEIWNRIFFKFPDWELSLLGDGIERERLENDSIKMGLERIKFHGLQNPVPFYERSKILCMTSAYEGFPLVLAEAQNFGVIPFAFKSFASIGDVIDHGENGFLIEPFDVEKYVSTLTELMKNNEKMKFISVNAQKSAGTFSIESIGGKWIELFNLLLK